MKSSVFFTAAAVLTTAALLVPAQAGVVITPSPGFTLAWDGNEADHFDAAELAPVPANLATTGTAFTSSDLGPELSIGYHIAANLNDGRYGNANSWIGGAFAGAPFAGIRLDTSYSLAGFAFGRDNGNNATDVNGGQLNDRSLGQYAIQITRVPNPDGTTPDTGDPISGWQTIGTLNYQSDDDAIAGGAFTSYFRHSYTISEGGAGVEATGFRILVPATGINSGTAIDEIELFGTVVPEPSSAVTLLVGLCGMALRRRRA